MVKVLSCVFNSAIFPSSVDMSFGIGGDEGELQIIEYPQPKKAMSRGEISVEIYLNRLRLRWSYAGKRYCLCMGLPNNRGNRIAAENKAQQIETDMLSEQFDPTLAKYKNGQVKRSLILATKLFELFMLEKAKSLYERSLQKYQGTLRYLEINFSGKIAGEITITEAEKLSDWLSERISPATKKERLIIINECWKWAIVEGLLLANPWEKLASRVKVPPKQKAQPFSQDEISRILEEFRNDKTYGHYTDYVQFLFGTGCRTGEAIGLRWGHLSNDCSSVWIGESLSRGIRKSTKTNKARTISLTASLQRMLIARKPENAKAEDIVFTTKKGLPISDQGFRLSPWKIILSRLEIEYRKPYSTRHTLISHALEMGMSPVMVAQLTGYDVATLYENYAGCVSSRPRLPEIILEEKLSE